ncbi:MAG: efflux RND transporter periplasmic adaptor subunit [Phycisphaerales bacterium]|nr:efflux RND transporter periplasmic adaptor subunit [Phycisphaerales bacterium]
MAMLRQYVLIAIGCALTWAILLGVTAAASAQQPVINGQTCPHDIDQAKCPFCDPTRIDRLGMCNEHGVPEALCVECRPLLKAAFIAAGDWCAEHAVPESQCKVCNPRAGEELSRRAAAAGAELRWQREPSPGCVTSSTPVTLTSSEALSAAGFEYTQISPRPLARVIERNAQVAYNTNRYARLSPRASGVVTEVLKDFGDRVRAGETVAIVKSTELGSAKADLLQAIELMRLWEANAKREEDLLARGVGIEREVLEAGTRLAEARITVSRARQRLRNLGLSDEVIDGVESDGDTSPLLQVEASFEGIVIDRTAVAGDVVEPGQPVMAIADTRVMWAMADLAESDLATVRVSQTATLMLDGLRGLIFPGRLTWISTALDPETRTLRARVEFDNAQGVLRANMFGRVRINTGGSEASLMLPKEAVQWEGCCNVAFRRSASDPLTFQPVRLVLGFDAGNHYEVLDGLDAGDVVVSRGSFILKNEILKNSVGAGCCEVDHLKK